MVAGPFDEHPLMAIQQKTKVCLILNLSAPENFSFIDTVDENRIRKLEMTGFQIASLNTKGFHPPMQPAWDLHV